MTYREISGKGAVAAHQHTKERDYWLNTLSGITGKSCFPYDNNTKQTERKTAAVTFSLPGDTCSRLVKLSGGSDVKLYMILTAGLVLLLNKYSGSPDIVVGTPIYKPDIEGKFINLALTLRNKLRQGMSFKDLLLQVRQTIIEAEKNRNYPIQLLPGELNMPFSGENDFPLFDTAVLLENVHYKEYLRHIHLNIVFSFLRTGETIVGEAAYNSLKYEEKTIRRICANFAHLLQGALGDVNLMLSDIDIVSQEEKKQLLFDFNDTRSEYPSDRTIHWLFEEQAAKTPGNTAIICADNHLTYRELNERSNRLAHVLIKRGVGPERIAALLMDNSLEMIIGIIGILKAGGAYLPINPGYPRERILSMLKDSRACLLLSKEMLIKDFQYIPLQDFETGDKKPVVTPCRAQVEDLDGLQIPNRSLIDYEKYRPYIGQAMVKNSITIHMSRGCVYNCAFCFKIWPKKYIIRSAENIFNEIYFYYKLGIRRFAFVDDLPNINIDISSKVFRLIIENGLKVHLHFPNGIRGDILTKEYIDLMAAAGTITMDLALETTSPRLQKLVRKNLNLKRLEENIEYITREHPQVILELQILHGIPTETEEEAAASLDFIKNIKWVHFPYIHILNIYPHSDMAAIAMEHGISREAIENSADIAYHELPETLPFSKEFTKKYQAEFLNEYFLSKERLLSVLPHQLNVLTEDELVQKYNSYLPMEIRRFSELLELVGISPAELKGEFLPEDYGTVPGFDRQLKSRFPQNKPQEHALNILLLDLSQYFTQNSKIMYDVVEPPLGLLYLMTHLEKTFGSKINGKIAKSRIDFDSFDELKVLVQNFKPDVIGIRTLNFYKDFFHKTISLLRQWGLDVPIIAGGPYATSHYSAMLRDKNIDLAVLGEGEITLADLVGKIIENNRKLPNEKILKTIPGIAFSQNKEKAHQQGFNREVLLFDSAAERLSGQSRKNPGIPGKSTDLAYIIYTSGSTGNPKGVMIQHNNLVNQVTGLIQTFDLDASFKYLLLASFTFDVSVMHIFTSLLTGARLYVIGDDIKKDSQRLWPFIYENKIDILNIVPAFMKAILKDIEKKKIGFRYLFVGGDVFDKELYTALRETFMVEEIINIYGPTETTINAALHRCRRRETGETLPIGKPLTNYRVSILDKESNPVPIGVKGELCISGAGVSRGYLNRPELTNSKFQALAGHPLRIPNSFLSFSASQLLSFSLYRTGDMARWLPDGNIEFLGRADNQVKIRGFRIEPGEIEKQLLNLEDITEAVVAAKEDIYGDKYLCAYIVARKNITGLREYLARHLPDYMVPAYFIQLEKIPLTPEHKVDRKALPDPGLEINRENQAPRNHIEKKLAGIWAAVLGREQENLGINTNFFELGGHSLTATILISKIHKTFNVKISLIQLFDTPTIKGLAKTLRHASPETFISIEPVEKKEYYALSAAQKRLYILNHIGSGSTNYNMPMGVLLEGDVEKKRFENAFKKLILRHETLRTSFEMINQQPVQRIHDSIHFEIDHFETGEEKKAEEIMDNFVKVFDLSQAPLFRVGMIKLTNHRYMLMVDMHHIISDGVSHPILIQDFMALYAGEHLPALTLQYKDYAQWQKLEKQTAAAKQQEKYWLRQFTGEIPVLHLSTDYSRPPVRSFEGSAVDFGLSGEETKTLNQMARSEGATLFMVVLALYNILLSKCSSREDIVIGTPISGRRHADVERIIGMFVNTLALRNYPTGEKKFVQFLREVKKRTLEAFENQDYQFEDLVEKAGVQRDTSRNPLFDVTFVLQDNPGTRENSAAQKMAGLTLKPSVHKRRTSKFDLSLAALETGERLYFEFVYCTRLFREETITRFINYFKRIVSLVVKKTGTKISGIEIISEEEKKQLLYGFNDTAAAYPRDKTLHHLFAEQAARTPDRVALVGNLTYRSYMTHMTYKQLNKKSDQLAQRLHSKGAAPGTIVGIKGERSVEMIVGILGILKAGGAYLPIDPGYPEERINYMLAESNTKVLLSELSEMSTLPAARSPQPAASFSDLAYIIYTSGTSGRPRGVMIEHRNAVNVVTWFAKQYVIRTGIHLLQMSDYTFDASVNQIFGSLLHGAALHVIPKELLRDIHALRTYIEERDIHIINFVPLLLGGLLSEGKKLESLQAVIAGGEKLDDAIKDRIIKKGYPLYNQYGPTETTIDALMSKCSTEKVNLGKPIANVACYILDEYKNLLPIGVVGELYVSGAGVARGYLNRPELTAEKFNRSYKSYGTFIFYKTGDLARWLPDRNIEFLGRIDQQVKIRGFRIELGEIENRLLEHNHISEAVVTARDDKNSDNYLCAYIVARSTEHGVWRNMTELREYLAQRLPDYMIPSYFVPIDKIPLTPNGKIDRKALPEPAIETGEEYIPPTNRTEKKLAQIWAEVLGIANDKISIDADFFDSGGHSLKATILAAKVHKALDVIVPLAEVFKKPTIRGLSNIIKRLSENKYAAIEPAEEKEYYALSPAQKRLYILQQMEAGNISYNLPNLISLVGDIDVGKIEQTFKKLLARHESLRTSFKMIDGEPVQRIHNKVEFEIQRLAAEDRQKVDVTGIIKNFIRPFDLSQAPLLRVGLIEPGDSHTILVIDMHHIITDGLSQNLLSKEYISLYNGSDEELPPPGLRYRDFSEWQNSRKKTNEIKQQEGFWLKEFEGEIPVLELPTDYERPVIQSFEGKRLSFELRLEESKELKKIARFEGATLFMMLLAVFNIFLSKLSSQEDIVVGTPIAGRKHADLEQVIGMFVNMLALKNNPKGEHTFTRFLNGLIKKTLAAFENQDYQFEDLVETAAVQRDMSRNPLFDAVFVLQNIFSVPEHGGIRGTLGEETGDLKKKNHTYEIKSSKFDLTLTALEIGETLYFSFEYCTKLFAEKTILRFITYFKKLISSVIAAPGKKISEIEIITAEEKKQLLYEFNDTKTGYPQDKTLHRLFEEQAARTPDRIAVVGISDHLTYRTYRTYMTYMTYKQLNKKSDQLAYRLHSKGVAPSTIVAVKTDRSVEMIVGLLSILKAGGAYLPIDLEYPEERINYMLEDSGAKVLLINLPEGHHLINCQLSMMGKALPATRNSQPATSLAYIIYTSGTTGRPKGVMIEHRNLVRLMFNNRFQFDFTHRDVWTMFHSYCFDFSVWEMYGALLYGGQLIIIPKNTARDSQAYLEILKKKQVTVLNQTPSAFYHLINLELKDPKKELNLRYVIFGGEALSPGRLKGWKEKYPRTKLVNMYGITETTVHVTYKEIGDSEIQSNISNIGKPIPTLSTYVMDKNVKLVPIGTAGELLVGGEGVGRGYLNRPELSKQKFVENPYKPAERLYRSGDMVKLSPVGDLWYSGRLDQQVKIRGFRIEPGEIENRLSGHREIEEAVVTTKVDEAGDRYLCAYIVSNNSIPLSQLREYLEGHLPDYMIPAYFMRIEKIPLTPNGKVDRKALPEPVFKAGGDYAPPTNQMEARLVEIWREVLGLSGDSSGAASSGNPSPGIDDDFFQLGGHSLKATILTAKIHKEFQVKLPLAELFTSPTIRGLSEVIKRAPEYKYAAIEPAEEKEYYELSPAQKRLYILQQMEAGNISYNLPNLIPLVGDIDVGKIERTFKKLLARHESLRTSFEMIGGEPVQRIHNKVEFEIQRLAAEDSQKVDVTGIIKDFIQPFDLSQAPLLRVGLIEPGDSHTILVIDMHHIITDGLSQNLLSKEYISLYNGSAEKLPPPGLRYRDFSEWQNSRKKTNEIKQQEAFWLKEFEGEIPVLELPTDYERPVIQSFEGKRMSFELRIEEAKELKKIARSEGATLFMMLLAVFNIFLSKLSSQEDIVVGTPIAGRKHADLEQVIGMFVNMLALKNNPKGEHTFTRFLNGLIKKTLEAFENQDYQFEDLVEKVVINRDTGRNPIFDTVFVFHEIDGEPGEKPGESEYRHESDISKFDLSLHAAVTRERLFFAFEYATKLFKPGTIERFITYFKRIVSAVVTAPGTKISDIELLSREEKHQFLVTFNDTKAGYPKDKTIHRLFEEQVMKTPVNIAVSDEEREITYSQLNASANRLARLLRKKGVKPDGIASIMMDRSIEMIKGILAVLKAGGAYLPIDPAYPAARKQFILEDSEANIMLTQKQSFEKNKEIFNHLSLEHVFLGLHEENIPGTAANPKNVNNPGDLAYIIYTSGTTGNPKGVMIEHKSVVNYTWWAIKTYVKNNRVNFPLYTSISFDLTVTSIFTPLVTGSAVVVYRDQDNEFLLEKIIDEHKVGIVKLTPSHLKAIQDKKIERSRIKCLVVGGENLETHLAETIHRNFKTNIEIYNEYGPTEASVGCMIYRFDPRQTDRPSVPIGIPADNIRIYLLDNKKIPLPPGIAGELYIGGDGVARGYWNQPAQTAEKFTANPFCKGDRLFKTGDLARRLPDGNIEFLGRGDHQVKIRGYRIEPGEIENRLVSHPEIEAAVVAAKEDEAGDRYLCAYIVARSTEHGAWRNLTELREYLAQRLPDFMIPACFMWIDKIPLTPNGKIDRKAFPEPVFKAGGDYAPPTDQMEARLVNIWQEVLGLGGSTGNPSPGIDDNFFVLGGHSLKATILTAKIHKELNVKLTLADIFISLTIRALAKKIKEVTECIYTSLKAAEKKEYYPLSSAQKRLYMLQQMEGGNISYNMPYFLCLEGNIEIEKMEETFKKLISRHEGLRTSFQMIGEVPVQKIHPRVEFKIGTVDLTKARGEHPASHIERFLQPFDLSCAPLLRVGLVKTAEKEHILMLDMHHIITDGRSQTVLTREFTALYNGEELPHLRLHYKDYCQWLNTGEARWTIKQQETFWLKEFEGRIPVLNIPLDFQRPRIQSFEGDTVSFEIQKKETVRLKEIAAKEDATLFMVLLAIYNVLLSILSGQEDIVIGTGTAGRRHDDLLEMIGMFVNTLALRNYPTGEKTFKTFLADVREKTLLAFDNQDYPFEELVEKRVPIKDQSRNPLFDTVLVLQDVEMSPASPNTTDVHSPPLKVKPYPYKNKIAKFDITLYAAEEEEKLRFIVEYRTKLFNKETIERFIRYFKEIVSKVVENIDCPLKDIAISHDLLSAKANHYNIELNF